MAEILTDSEIAEIETRAHPFGADSDIVGRLIRSHRALAAERDNYQRMARNMEEAVDGVRESLGLESTHYLVVADQVADVVKERDATKARIRTLESACEAALPPLKWAIKHNALPAEFVEHTKALIEQHSSYGCTDAATA